MHPFDVHPRYLVVGLAALGLLLLLTRGGGRDDPYISAWRGAPPARTLGTAPAAFVGTAAPLAGRTMGGDTEEPRGNPLQSPRAIMTQGYGVGSHARLGARSTWRSTATAMAWLTRKARKEHPSTPRIAAR
jgi:hypothetical protein